MCIDDIQDEPLSFRSMTDGPTTAETPSVAWWDDPQAAQAVLARYDAVRGKTRDELTARIWKRAAKPELHQAGRELGLLRQGVLCFDSAEHSAIFTDYLLFFSRMHGTTPCERYLKSLDRTHEDDVTRAAHDAIAGVRYTWLVLEEPRPGLGYVCHDVLRNQQVFLVDRSMSKTRPHSVAMATAVFPVDNWVMSTGAGLPIVAPSIESATALMTAALKELGLKTAIPAKFSGKDESRLMRAIIRTLIANGVLERIRYE
jgi:hypothetical protein